MPDSKRTPEAKERRRLKAKVKREYRYNCGLCLRCGMPIVPNKTLCSTHLEMARNSANINRKDPRVIARIRKYNRTIGRFKHISKLAPRQGKEWSLPEYVWEQIILMPCKYCGLQNNIETGAGLDRLDNSKGYIADNVVSCCYECNTARADNFTPEEMIKEIGPAIRRIKLSRVV